MGTQNFVNKKYHDSVLKGVESMCQVFWGPDLESCRSMMEKDFFFPFETLNTKSAAALSLTLDNINSIINRFDTCESLFDHLNQCYVRLFVNSREGIAAPLYESCYEFENAPMMGESAIKMKNCFNLRGLSMENRVHEPPDHLCIELEYLFFLLQESSTAGVELIDEATDEAVLFAKETMLPWVTIFSQRLEFGNDDCRFFFLASCLLLQLLGMISGRV